MRSTRTAQFRWEPILLMVAIAIALTVLQHRASGGRTSSFPVRIASRVVLPVQSAMVAGGDVLSRMTTAAFSDRAALLAENEELRRRVAEAEADKLAMLTYYHQNRAMKEKLGWDATGQSDGTAARVIDWSSGPSRRQVTIEANRELERGNIVRTARGLVGRVIEAQGRRGVVVLLTDAEHAVAARILRAGGDYGIVYAAPDAGRGEQMLMLSKLPTNADVRQGDRVVSSGLGGVYPPDLPIGVVVSVERSPVNAASIVAYVRPYADFEHLDYVRVIRRGE